VLGPIHSATTSAPPLGSHQELAALLEGSRPGGYLSLIPRLCRLLHAAHVSLVVLVFALRGALTRRQLACACVCSWPFFPSPVDLLAMMQEENGAAAPLGPAGKGPVAAAAATAPCL
jgi:hypothetical protein